MLIQFDLRDGVYGLRLDKDEDGAFFLQCRSATCGAPACKIVLDEGQAIDITEALLKALGRKAIEQPCT